MSVIWGMLRNRWSAPSLKTLQALPIAGRTVIIIGASGGLGLEAARHYVRLGASRVILGVRSQKKGDDAKRYILDNLPQEETKSCVIDVWMIDLASFESVQAFATKAVNELPRIDIALLNAAVSKGKYETTKDGWEESLQVNVLSPTLLALLLLPKLRQSARPDWTPRLNIVASRQHAAVSEGEPWQTSPNIMKTLNREDEFGKFADRYGVSKLLVIYAAREIANLSATAGGKPQVIVSYSCPGACISNLAQDWQTPVQKAALAVTQATICKTTEEGSRTLVYATGLDKESHGRFVHRDRLAEPGTLVTNAAGRKMQAQVWSEILQTISPYGIDFEAHSRRI